jgi:hypothetical protein
VIVHPRWNDVRTQWAAAAGVAGLVATWLAGAVTFYQHDADTLVPKLASTMEWSFYYWHAGRNGQLLPLLAMPFSHPLTNLVAQQWLGTWAGVMAIYLLVAFVMRGREWFVPGTAAVACFLMGATCFGHAQYLEGSNTFGTAMALVLGGLLLVRRASLCRADAPRLGAAAVLIAAGAWVNLLVCLFAATLVACDALSSDDEPTDRELAGEDPLARLLADLPAVPPLVHIWLVRSALSLGLVVACAATLVIAVKLFATGGGSERVTMSFVPLASYASSLTQLTTNIRDTLVAPAGALLVAMAVVAAAWLEGRGARSRAVAVLAATGLVFFLVVGGLKWVAMNACHPRYVLPAIIAAYACVGMLLVAAVREAATGVRDASRLAARASWVMVMTIPAVLFLGYGFPDAAAPRRAIAGLGSPFAEQVVESGVEFVAGDYWRLWPVVFKANLLLQDRGEPRRVWGLGLRAGATRHRWEAVVRDGEASVAHLTGPPKPPAQDLRWIADHLDLEIGDRSGVVGDLDLYRFRLSTSRIARR